MPQRHLRKAHRQLAEVEAEPRIDARGVLDLLRDRLLPSGAVGADAPQQVVAGRPVGGAVLRKAEHRVADDPEQHLGRAALPAVEGARDHFGPRARRPQA